MVKQCKEAIQGSISRNGICTRWNCLSLALGFFEARKVDSVPIELIDWINKLCQDGVIEA